MLAEALLAALKAPTLTASLGLSIPYPVTTSSNTQHGPPGPIGFMMGPVHGVYLACPNEPSVYITGDTVLVNSVTDAVHRLKVCIYYVFVSLLRGRVSDGHGILCG